MRITQLIIFGLSLFFAGELSAKIKISIDRNDIRANETFQMTLEVENPQTLSSRQSMDFIPQEWQVLGSENFQKSTVINNQFANRMGWTITLISSQAGTFSIPAFNIGNEQSDATTIRILPPLTNLDELNPNSQIKLAAQISDEEVYVQQQIIYNLRIYSSVPSRRHNISPLTIENAVVKKLGEASDFQMLYQGVRYNVKEEKYVIFPQKSGELSIPPIQFRTNIVDPQASYGSLSRYRPIELKSKPFKIKVKPKPEAAEQPWIPAKSLELTAQWQTDSNDFEVGKPATLDFYIKGVALLPEQLPTVEFPDVQGLKIYRDKPVLQNRIGADGVTSYHLEKLAVIPNQTGEVTIPTIKIPYWDTVNDQQAYAELQPIKVTIQQQQNSVALPAISQQSSAESSSTPTITTHPEKPFWRYLTIIFGALWIITLTAFFFKRPKKAHSKTEDNANQEMHKEQLISLQQAAKKSDPSVMAKATIQWVNARSKIHVSNLNQLITYCPDQALQQELLKLQNALYAKNSNANDWNGALIADKLSKICFSKVNNLNGEQLPPLYPK